MKFLATGATGFIGRRLVEKLDRPFILRRPGETLTGSFAGLESREWDLSTRPPAEAFSGVDAVIHLAGEPILGRWSPEKKRRIRDSRAIGTANLAGALRALAAPPKVLVSMSAVGYYGDRGDEILEETSPAGSGFMAEVCRDWEAAAAGAAAAGIRVVSLRAGPVLLAGGGALKQMLTPFRLGLGGPLGNGRQWFPWIHMDDLVGLLLHAVEHDEISGPVNAVAPEQVTNAGFTRALGAALRRPAVLPVPAWVLRLVYGDAAAVMLSSHRVVPAVAERTGYRFRHPSIAGALRHAL